MIVRPKKSKNIKVEDNLIGFFKSVKQAEQSFIHKGQKRIIKLPIIKKCTWSSNRSTIPTTNITNPAANVK